MMLSVVYISALECHVWLTHGAHAHRGYSTLCVCRRFLARLYNTLMTEIGFMLDVKDFQLTDFSKKASFKSYSVFVRFHDMAAIL